MGNGAKGEGFITVKVVPQTAKEVSPVNLKVSIMSARALRKADLTGKSDPYVVCRVDEAEKMKTPVIDNNQNPVWNFGPLPVVYQSKLEFRVYDQDPAGDDLLGMALLEREQFCVKGFEGELPLLQKN